MNRVLGLVQLSLFLTALTAVAAAPPSGKSPSGKPSAGKPAISQPSSGQPPASALSVAMPLVHAVESRAPAEVSNTGVRLLTVPPAALVHEEKEWSVISSRVNRITCAAESPEVSWLGTELGVKQVDRKSGRVTHYTREQGLPGDRITAIVRHEEAVWCLVAVEAPDTPLTALCRLETNGRWRVLLQVPRPRFQRPAGQGFSLQSDYAGLTATREWVCFSVSPASEKVAYAYLYDVRAEKATEIIWKPSLRNDQTRISVTFLGLERESVWLGTTSGVIRQPLGGGEQERFLPNHSVYAAHLEGRELWVAGTRQEMTESGPRTHRVLTRLDLESGQSQDFALPDLGDRPNWQLLVTGVTRADEAIWVSLQHRDDLEASAFYRFDPKTEAWRTLRPSQPAEFAAIPDAALLKRAVAAPILLAHFIPRRWPAWFCKAESIPGDVDKPIPPAPPAVRSPEGVWRIERRTLLKRFLESGAPAEEHSTEGITINATRPLQSLMNLDGSLFAVGGDGVYRLELPGGSWTHRKALSEKLPPRARWETAVAAAGSLWVAGRTEVVRVNPRTEDVTVAADSGGVPWELLGVLDGVLWLRDIRGVLLRLTPSGMKPEPMAELNPPGALAKSMRPFYAAAGRIWGAATLEEGGRKRVALFGYDPAARSWSQPLRLGAGRLSPNSFLEAGKELYLWVDSGLGPAVHRWDAAAGEWLAITPAASGRGLDEWAEVVAIDSSSIWVLDPTRWIIRRIDRATQRWTELKVPGVRPVRPLLRGGVRIGEALYVASREGLQKLPLLSQRWETVRTPSNGPFHLLQIAAQGRYVWAVLDYPGGVWRFAARLDRTTRKWTAWDATSGIPPDAFPEKLLADGESAWVLTSGHAYRFNPARGRWENQSARLPAPPHFRTLVRDLVPDASGFLLKLGKPTPVEIRAGLPPLPSSPGLAHFDRASGSLRILGREGGPNAPLNSLVVEPGALYATAENGLFKLDRAANRWSALLPSFVPAGTSGSGRLVEVNGILWFTSDGLFVRRTRATPR